jgi:hypothetical protein
MSIWGAQAQENDDASDWLSEFEDEPDILQINEALNGVLGAVPSDYIEITEGAVAVAAATVVARMCGLPFAKNIVSDDTLADLMKHANKMAPGAKSSLIRRALSSLDPVQDPERSELCELMMEDPELGAAWRQRMGELKDGLEDIYQRLTLR